ncbi:MAG TPA: MATE family efflux transporter, partial [Pseudogracilibacillus sp.]|nr:MATE family efflux transporter [Pseudogracilibacillus sp.]
MTTENRLQKQSVSKSFFQYLIPSLIGMALLSVNIIIDGIFVGHGVGSVALAAVNVASPVFSIFLSIALLIGIGGGAVYSMMLGKNEVHQAQRIFTTAMALVTVITFVISIISYLFMEQLAFFFGANEETLPFVVEYIRILLIFSLFVVW